MGADNPPTTSAKPGICVLPKPLPLTVICAPMGAEERSRLLMVGAITAKDTALLIKLCTVTTTSPLVAPSGTLATMVVGFQVLMIVAGTLLKVMVPREEPKFCPLVVTWLPIAPEGCERPVITGVAGVTVSVVEPTIAPDVAVMVVVPTPTAVASPAALIVAAEEEDEAQIAVLVKSCVLPSVYVPVAVNCWVEP